MKTIALTYENADTFYGKKFYGKSSGDIVTIIGKTETRTKEQVLLLDNRRFVTIGGFNKAYASVENREELRQANTAIIAEYEAQFKALGYKEIDYTVYEKYFMKGKKGYRLYDHSTGSHIRIAIDECEKVKEVVRPYAHDKAVKHIECDRTEYMGAEKVLRALDFEKAIGTYKSPKDFAKKFFAKYGFLKVL